MAHVTTDAELMTNYVSAVPVPAGSHFVTVLDENLQTIVLSLSNDKVPQLQISKHIHTSNRPTVAMSANTKRYAVRHNTEGVQYLFDLGSCFDLPADAIIQSFAIVQAADRTLYLAFAYLRDSTSSHVVLARPFAPSDLHKGAKLQKIPSDGKIGTVRKMYMVSAFVVIV